MKFLHNYDLQIQNANGNAAEIERLTREFCMSNCVTQVYPACTSLDPSIATAVDRLMQGMRSNIHYMLQIIVYTTTL